MKKVIILSIAITIICSSFKTIQAVFIAPQTNAELVVVDVKVKIIGNSEYSFTQVNGNFYNPITDSNGDVTYEKLHNNDVFVNDISTMFSIVDSTYKIIDTTLNTSVNNNFTWKFKDLTNSDNVLQYTTTKPITRVAQLNLSGISNVNKSLGFSYAHPLIQADSIVYILGADSLTSVKKTVYNQSYGVSYSSTELSGLATTNEGAFIMLVFNTMSRIYSGKNYHFQNNSAVTVMPLPIN